MNLPAVPFSSIPLTTWKKGLRSRVEFIDSRWDGVIYNRVIEALCAENGVAQDCFEVMQLPPKLVLHNTDTLPQNIKPVSNDEDSTFHLAIGARAEDIGAQLKRAYKAHPVEPELLPLPTADHQGVRLSDGRDEKADIAIPLHDNSTKYIPRGDFDPFEKPDLTKSRLNTLGQINKWRRTYQEHLKQKSEHPDEITLWERYQQKMFSPEILERFANKQTISKTIRIQNEAENGFHEGVKKIDNFPMWKFWIRGLRIMAGKSTEDMAHIPGLSNWSHVETTANTEFTPEALSCFMKKNPCLLPRIKRYKHTYIDERYASIFRDMVSEKWANKYRVLPAIKAIATAYLQGTIDYEEMPTINEVLPLVYRAKATPHSCKNQYKFLDSSDIHTALTINDQDYTEYLKVLPHLQPVTGKTAPTDALTSEQAFEYASNTALHLGDFLLKFRESRGISSHTVAQLWGNHDANIRVIEEHSHHEPCTLDKILSSTNPYDLPTDGSGNVRSDVMARIRNIGFEHKRYNWLNNPTEEIENLKAHLATIHTERSKWLGFGEVLAHSDTPYWHHNDVASDEAFPGTKLKVTSKTEGFSDKAHKLHNRWTKKVTAVAEHIKPWDRGKTIKLGETEVEARRMPDGEVVLDPSREEAIRSALANHQSGKGNGVT